MKIGLVSPYDWSYPGGVRDHVWHLANEFIAKGHDVRIMAPASGPKSKLTEKYILKMGWTTPIPINGSIARIMLDPSIALRVRRVLQREHFDVIHVHEPSCTWTFSNGITLFKYSYSWNISCIILSRYLFYFEPGICLYISLSSPYVSASIGLHRSVYYCSPICLTLLPSRLSSDSEWCEFRSLQPTGYTASAIYGWQTEYSFCWSIREAKRREILASSDTTYSRTVSKHALYFCGRGTTTPWFSTIRRAQGLARCCLFRLCF